ncbi:MAG: hypothetical protein RL701_7140, partial [Pseudomonadota bacterium]
MSRNIMEPRQDAFGHYERPARGHGTPRYRDRADAGLQLAAALSAYRGSKPLVLGIPRGGVPVAHHVAQELEGELDVIVARKLGMPGQEEYAFGAVASDGTQYVNAKLQALAGVSATKLSVLAAAQRTEAERREQLFRAGLPALQPHGRIAIVVDDGLATGATMRVA